MSLKKYQPIFLFLAIFISGCGILSEKSQPNRGLKDYYKNYFPIGVAVNAKTITGEEGGLLLREFNSITPENVMKMSVIHPKEGSYNWTDADAIVDFAVKNKLRVRGHTLLWHEQTPDWIFKNLDGSIVSREVLLKRLKDHIFTVMGRYKGRVYAWDVVNEAIDDNPNNFLRKSPWYTIIGDDFIAKAFEYAHQADPTALLFYNDYNTERPSKRENIYRLLKGLKEKGIPVHGVGLQAHWSVFEPSEEELGSSIERYSSLGLQLHFTEVDVSVYPWEKEKRKRRDGEDDVFTVEREQQQIQKYAMVFKVFRKYRKEITSVTFWNLSDRYSWLDYYPVEGRKNYPLLFDTKLGRKKAYWEVAKF